MSLLRAGLWLALLALASKVVGLVRESLVAYYFGTSEAVGAFVIASTVPLIVLNTFMGGAVVGSFVPAFTRRRLQHSDAEAWRYAKSIAALLIGASIVFTGWLVLAAPWVVDLLGPGLTITARAAAIVQSRLVVLSLPFFVTSTLASAVLNAHDRFRAAGSRMFVNNLAAVVILLTLTARLGPMAMAVGFVVGAVLQLAVQLVSVWPLVLPHFGKVHVSRTEVQDFFVSYLPIFGTHLMLQGATVLDRSFSTTTGPDGAAALQYAERLIDIARTLVGSSLATVIFPPLARLSSADEDINELVRRALGIVIFATVPLAFAFLVFGDGFVALFYQRGQFGASANARVTLALVGMAPATITFALIYVFDRLFVARGRVWTYAGLMAVGLGVNYVAKALLVQRLGLLGVAIGTSLGTTAVVIMCAWYFHRAEALTFVRPALRDLGVAVVSCCIGFGVAVAGKLQWPMSGALSLYAGVFWSGVGLVPTLAVMYLLRLPTLLLGIEMLRARAGWSSTRGVS